MQCEPCDAPDAEEVHFRKIVTACYYYRTHALKRVAHAEKQLEALTAAQRAKIPGIAQRFEQQRSAVEANAALLAQIVAPTTYFQGETIEQRLGGPTMVAGVMEPSVGAAIPDWEMDKVYSTLKQFSREWGAEGKAERDACFGPVLDQLQEHCGAYEQRRVLLPGAGLGRLAYEVAMLGYETEGNEFSYYMLLGSSFILNRTNATPFQLQPFATTSTNVVSGAAQLRTVAVPDVAPCSQSPPPYGMGMCAGEFVEVYEKQPDCYDSVVTLFFIDTAKNIVEYIETIYKILRPGGAWINFGPLLWHFSGMEREPSIDLTLEEVKAVCVATGFVFVKEEDGIECCYTNDATSLMRTTYSASLWTCIKPAEK